MQQFETRKQGEPHKRGWTWFDQAEKPPVADQDLAQRFARCFQGAEGDALLAHLVDMTMGRPLGANTRNDILRHVEGQRYLVAYLMTMVRKGREGE